MSRPKHYWFGISKGMICRYTQIKNGESRQEKNWTKAIEDALEAARGLENGEYRVEAIRLVLLDKKLTQPGAADALHYSERTIRRWIEGFVNDVGRRAGY